MSRCEDFPCCGHGNDPGGCPDFETTRNCKDCGTAFHPDSLTWDYCYGCADKPRLGKWTLIKTGSCECCGDKNVELYECKKWTACADCQDEADTRELNEYAMFGPPDPY